MRKESFNKKIEGFESSDPAFKKAIVSVTLLAMAVGLVLLGFVFGIPPVFKYLATWHESKSYLPVEAKVLEVRFFSEPHKKINGITGKVTVQPDVSKNNRTAATFEYEFQGKKYSSHRTTLLNEDYEGRDNYPKELFDQLNAKFTAGEAVTLWLDPQHPDQALYDRSILWLAIIFLFPLAFACPLAAIWLIMYVISLWRDRPSRGVPPDLAADTAFAETNNWLVIQAEPDKSVRGILVFLLLISLMWPIAPYAWIYPSTAIFGTLFRFGVAMWCSIGLIPLVNSAKAWKAKQRLGNLYLLIAPQKRQNTNYLQGLIRFVPPLASKLESPSATVEVRIRLEYLAWCIEGKSEWGYKRPNKDLFTLWQSKELNLLAPRGTQRLEFEFDFPEKVTLSPYDEYKYIEYFWKIRVEISGCLAEFKLPGRANIPIIIPTIPQFRKRPVAA